MEVPLAHVAELVRQREKASHEPSGIKIDVSLFARNLDRAGRSRDG